MKKFNVHERNETSLGEDASGDGIIESERFYVEAEPEGGGRLDVKGVYFSTEEFEEYFISAPANLEPEEFINAALEDGFYPDSLVEVRIWDVEEEKNRTEEHRLGTAISELGASMEGAGEYYTNIMRITEDLAGGREAVWSMEGRHSPGIEFQAEDPDAFDYSIYFVDREPNSDLRYLATKGVLRKLESFDSVIYNSN